MLKISYHFCADYLYMVLNLSNQDEIGSII
jgi:hypothetical protein